MFQPSIKMPMAAVQLPATRTMTRAQGRLRETIDGLPLLLF
jgi:hypothetical protein